MPDTEPSDLGPVGDARYRAAGDLGSERSEAFGFRLQCLPGLDGLLLKALHILKKNSYGLCSHGPITSERASYPAAQPSSCQMACPGCGENGMARPKMPSGTKGEFFFFFDVSASPTACPLRGYDRRRRSRDIEKKTPCRDILAPQDAIGHERRG